MIHQSYFNHVCGSFNQKKLKSGSLVSIKEVCTKLQEFFTFRTASIPYLSVRTDVIDIFQKIEIEYLCQFHSEVTQHVKF